MDHSPSGGRLGQDCWIAADDLLITDETNPRSILFQLQTINELLGQLPTDTSEFGLGSDQKIAEKLLHRVRMSEPAILCDDRAGHRGQLQLLLELLIEELPDLSNAITARYLIHTGTTRISSTTRPRQTSAPRPTKRLVCGPASAKTLPTFKSPAFDPLDCLRDTSAAT